MNKLHWLQCLFAVASWCEVNGNGGGRLVVGARLEYEVVVAFPLVNGPLGVGGGGIFIMNY